MEAHTFVMKIPAEGTGGGVRRGGDHWAEIARQWRQAGPPLRPSMQDMGFCADAIRGWHRQYGAPRVLLLGVTPDIYGLSWPKGTEILAVDRSQAMIDIVWKGPSESVLCADWLDIRLPDGSRDIALCDGGLHLLSYPREQRQLVRVLRRVLAEKGLCLFRLFIPQQKESPDEVLKDLLEGRIVNLNILKLRLAMSLQENAEKGVELRKIWRAVHGVADLPALAERIGWPIEHMSAINVYRDSAARYHFVDVDQVIDLFCGGSGGFTLRSIHIPSYELGERCPTIVLQRGPDADGQGPVSTGH